MKKVFFTGVFALALVAIIGYGINKNQNVEQLSDLALQNVEALAQEEGGTGGGYSCSVTSNCFSILSGQVLGSVSCSGKNCERGTGYVKCDGKRTEC